MRIVEKYSHLNGLEYLLVHKKKLWQEIQRVIKEVDANVCKTKISREKTMRGKRLFSPKDMNKQFDQRLTRLGWKQSRVSYWVTKDVKLIRQTLPKSSDEQKKEIEAAGEIPIFSYNQTDFVKDRVAIEFSSESIRL